MRSGLALIVLAIGCGSTGPNLPNNVGANHARTNAGEGAPTQPQAVNSEPVEPGAHVWANFRDAGFFFHGVIVERQGALHRIVYDDGETEWLQSSALRPDSLGEGAEVNVRRTFGGRFNVASVERRVGRALYLHYAGGDEAWTSLAHVRFQSTDIGAPSMSTAPHAETAGEIGSSVLVDYRDQGLRFAATVTARRDDGFLHVVYMDGETEWVAANSVVPDDVRDGSIVHVRRAWDPPQWLQARVDQRVGDALHVTFEDGGTAWTSMFRVRVPSRPDAGAAAEVEIVP
jgi:hypothetical protein